MAALGNHTARLNGLIKSADDVFDNFTPAKLRGLENLVSVAFIKMQGNMSADDRMRYSALQGKIQTLHEQEKLMNAPAIDRGGAPGPAGELPPGPAGAVAPEDFQAATRGPSQMSEHDQLLLALALSQTDTHSRAGGGGGGGGAAVEEKDVERQNDAVIYEARLIRARQYDMPGEKPPACTLHAVHAMSVILPRFNEVFGRICVNDPTLSNFQKKILAQGIESFQKVTGQNAKLRGGMDLPDISAFTEKTLGFPLVQPKNHQDIQPFNDRLNNILQALFESDQKVAWIKTSNDESFAIIRHGTRAIIFDSHKNIMIATSSRDALEAFLREKLGEHVHEIAEMGDLNQCSYAIGDPSQEAGAGCVIM